MWVKPAREDDFVARRIFSLEMVRFGAFSVAKEAAVTGTFLLMPLVPPPLPNAILLTVP